MPTKTKTNPEAEAEEVNPEAEEAGLAIDLNPSTFNRAERRELQERYGAQFETLVDYVNDGFFGRPTMARTAETKPDGTPQYVLARPGPVPPFDGPDGKVFADDVVISMLAIVHRRDHPDATEAMFDQYSNADLVTIIGAGLKGKAEKRSSGSSKPQR